MTVNPGTLSGLVASAQQFREQSQMEVCSKDRAITFGLVRPSPKPSGQGPGTPAWPQ